MERIIQRIITFFLILAVWPAPSSCLLPYLETDWDLAKKPDCSYSLTRALALYLFLLQIFFAIPKPGALESCKIAESPYLDRSDTQRYPVLACHIRTLFLGLELHRCLWVRSKWDLFSFLYWLWHYKLELLTDILPIATICAMNILPSAGPLSTFLL